VKFEDRAAVERCEFLAFELELDSHDRSRRSSGGLFCGLAVVGNFPNLRIFENGGIKFYRLLGLIIEPQEWCYFLHVLYSFVGTGGYCSNFGMAGSILSHGCTSETKISICG